MADDNEEESISIDFGKIKNLFKKKEGVKQEDKSEVLEKKHKAEEESQRKEEIKKKPEEEEEIHLDFSKITKLFKREGGIKPDKEEKRETGEDEEGISFDIKKIKGFFKREKEEAEEKKPEEDISFDVSVITNFFKKNVTLLLILIPLFLSIYLRMQPAYLPITDNWAKDTIESQIRAQIRTQVDQSYPNLPDANKNQLVESQYKEFKQKQKSQIKEQVKLLSNAFKARLKLGDADGQTYLLEMDPYFWMRDAKNLLEKGHVGDEIRNNEPWDNHMLAPLGRPADVHLHPYLIAYLYKFISIFNRDADLMSVTFYIPVFLSALAVIPAFFIARKVSGNFGGLIAAMVIAIHPEFLTRTVAGFSDTDAYNVLFPLLITWCFLEAFEAETRNKRIGLAALSGFLTGFFAFAWIGWWYIFLFIVATSIIYIIYSAIMHIGELKKGIVNLFKQPGIKDTVFLLSIFILSSIIFVSLFKGFDTIKNLAFEPINFIKLKEVGIDTVWPNVFTTVAEQNPASLGDIISIIGTGWIFPVLISLMGLAFTLIRKDSKRMKDFWFIAFSIVWFVFVLTMNIQDLRIFLALITIPIIAKIVMIIIEKDTQIDAKISLLLIIWLLSTIYAGTKGLRFTLLLVPAFGIAFGIALGISYNYLSNWISRGLHLDILIPRITLIIISFLIIGFVVIPLYPFCVEGTKNIKFMCYRAKQTALNEIPLINDAWYSSLTKIKENSTSSAIITSWWDFGHWFKYVPDRQVTFDGTSQNSPQAHWVGNILLTGDEGTAIGILRMLDCGATNAFDELNNVINDHPLSIDILYKIVVGDKDNAIKILKGYGLNNEQIDAVIKNTHCKPPEAFFITSQDMVYKSGVWAHFGSWDFNKALIYNTLKRDEYQNSLELSADFLQKRFNYTKKEAEDVFYEVQSITSSDQANSWISPWPSYAGWFDCSKVDDKNLKCGFIQGLNVDIKLDTMEADIQTAQGILHPNVIAYPTKDGIKKREFNSTIGLGITLVPSGESYRIYAMSPELVSSMFTRLFYMEGHGLDHFRKFSDETSVTGQRIIVWKVDWEGSEMNIMEELKPKKIVAQNETTDNAAEIDISNGSNITSSI